MVIAYGPTLVWSAIQNIPIDGIASRNAKASAPVAALKNLEMILAIALSLNIAERYAKIM